MTTATRTSHEQPVSYRPQVLPVPAQLVVTTALLHELGEDHTEGWVQREIIRLVERHHMGDWGELDSHDQRMNEIAVQTGDRILSRYTIDGTAIYVITDAGHASCCVMRVTDY